MAVAAASRATVGCSPTLRTHLRLRMPSTDGLQKLPAAVQRFGDRAVGSITPTQTVLLWHTSVLALGSSLVLQLRRRRLQKAPLRNACRFAGSASRYVSATCQPSRYVSAAAVNAGSEASGSIIPKVLFVLGGPGAGKGTQCEKIIERFPQWAHVSAGDCLRAERNDPSSRYGDLINTTIKEGKIVPVAITVRLLQKAMALRMAEEGKTCFLIDGFPRNLDNNQGWEEVMGAEAKVCGVLFYEVPEEVLERRLLSRGETSGRTDDNIESIRKRFITHRDDTMPIVESYREQGLVFTIDATPSVDDVWATTEAIVQRVTEMP